jgi:hypothetical protein
MVKHVVGTCAVSLVLTAAASAQTPVGTEFRVNTFTTGHQAFARPAMGPGGDFVIVWMSDAQVGNNYGAFGQRFAASGAPRGSEFRINTSTTGFNIRPAVAVGSGGDFVVVWETQDGSGSDIHGQRFDAGGEPIGAEFLVNTFTTGNQYDPHVGRASDGGFVVSWTSPSDGSSYGIAARRFDASGDPIGAEFVVNTLAAGNQNSGDLAVDANGNFVAVWEDCCRDGSGTAIFGQRFDAADNRLGGEFQVNNYATGFQQLPSVSVSPVGGFVVVWRSELGDGSAGAVFARHFDASGNAVGNDFVVNTFTPGNQYGIIGQVAHDAAGNFVITWGGPGDGSGTASFAQRFSSSGVRRGVEFRVNTHTTANQRRPSVASDPMGNFVITWQSAGQDGSGDGIFAQRYGDLIFQDGFES